jgi:glycosyltransferase involved in cell wall biosynthesis
MRIAFTTPATLEFGVESAYRVPLGGSESALCYLTEALALQRNEVFLLNNTSVPALSRGVQCLRAESQVLKSLKPLDAVVVQNSAGQAAGLRRLITGATLLVLWTGHAHDQPVMRPLHDPGERDAYDGIAFVSEWQRGHFVQHFGIEPGRTAVLRNGIGPAFRGLFADGESITAQKSWPPVLAYTSAPYRGLVVLLDVLPGIRSRLPGTRLKVFSSLQGRNISAGVSEAELGRLYKLCESTDGVEYVGPVPQPVLARELRSVAALAYPSIFEETSCIAVLEAMAAGCWIVASDLAALPETTAGFGSLVPLVDSPVVDYRSAYVEAATEVFKRLAPPNTAEIETHLRRQVNHVNEACTWHILAKQWAQWLATIKPRGA